MNIKVLLVVCSLGGFLLLMFLGFLWWNAEASGMAAMIQLVRTRFPSVTQITTDDLASWLEDPDRPQPILLDVRTQEEYDVSHLSEAHQIDPDSRAADVLRLIGNEQPVVVYCSVGYRSSQLAKRLKKAGFENVVNLEGSIFAWASEDRKLVSDGKPTSNVHPYNQTFGKLLPPRNRAASPNVKR